MHKYCPLKGDETIKMMSRICIFLLLFSVNLTGQAVNEKINVILTQAAQLRVNAGYDITMEEDGTVVIGSSVYTYGGTPEFSYEWMDEQDNFFYEKTAEVSNTGDYILTVTDQRNCTAADTLTVIPLTGVFPAGVFPELKIYFDPATKSVTLFSPGSEGTSDLSIINMKGEVLFNSPLDPMQFSDTYQVDLDHFKPGIYLVYLKGKQHTAVSKFIVQ